MLIRSSIARLIVIGLLIAMPGVAAAQTADFVVPPLEGAPPPYDERVARLVAQALVNIDISATNEPDEDALFVLKGVAQAASDSQGTTTNIRWDVANEEGSTLLSLQVEDVAPYMANGDPWDALDLNSLKRLAEKTADAVEASREQLETAALAAPSQTTSTAESPGRLAIGAISGAPGDGNDALATALAQVMKQYRVTVEPNPGPGIYLATASIAVVDKDAETQTVRIDWRLSGPGGQNYGLVEQENDVPRGSLAANWGDVAVYAAAGAGDGIVALMQQLGPAPPNVND